MQEVRKIPVLIKMNRFLDTVFASYSVLKNVVGKKKRMWLK